MANRKATELLAALLRYSCGKATFELRVKTLARTRHWTLVERKPLNLKIYAASISASAAASSLFSQNFGGGYKYLLES
jgi:hypothetical protein